MEREERGEREEKEERDTGEKEMFWNRVTLYDSCLRRNCWVIERQGGVGDKGMDWIERSLRLGDRRRKFKEFRLFRSSLSVCKT